MEKKKRKVSGLRFKRWSGKSYAVFNSLGRVVSIAVLPAVYMSFADAKTPGTSRLETQEAYALETVEVVGEPLSEPFGQAAVAVQVITKSEIAVAAVENVQDLLEWVGGIDIRQRGTNGAQADISIRGSSADQVLILLNGINITDAQTGHYNLNLPVPLAAIDRIEILQGSGVRTLGATAFGGAINIITDEKRKSGVSADITVGEHGYGYQSANGTLVKSNTSTSLAVSRQRSAGYAKNTDFDVTNAFLQSMLSTGGIGKIQLQAGLQDKGAGANDFYYFGGVQYDWQRTYFGALSWQKVFSPRWSASAQAYWRELHNRFESYRDFENAPDSYTTHNYHRTDIFGSQAKVQRRSSTDKTVAGIDIRNEHIFSNKLGDPLATPRPAPFAPRGVEFIFGKNRVQATAFADETLYLGRLTLAAGAVLNQSNDYGTNLSGGADAAYQFTPRLKVYAAANHAFRFPTYTDLYYTTNESHTSDPNLKPEQATTFEVGAKYVRNGFRMEGDVYYRIGREVIDWVRPFGTTAKWQGAHSDINAAGGMLAAQYVFGNDFFLRKAALSYSYLTQDKKAIAGYDSKYALDYLRHKLVFALNHKILGNLSLNWNATLEDRNGDYTLNNERHLYKPFFILDARLLWQMPNAAVFADFNNLLNRSYADFGGIVQPGLWIRTGISLSLGT